MRTTSFSKLRRHLAATFDSVNATHELVIITRGRGKPSAVLMSLRDLASYEETIHLLSSPRNAKRLLSAIKALDREDGKPRAPIA